MIIKSENLRNDTADRVSVCEMLMSVPLVSVLKRSDCVGCRSNSNKTDHFNAVILHRDHCMNHLQILENNKEIKVCLNVLFSNGACSFMHMLLGKCHHFFLISLKSGLTYCS